MKTILLFGAGKSASVLIDYLLSKAPKNEWKLILVDANLELAQSKLDGSPFGEAFSFDVLDSSSRIQQVQQADLVISLLPPHLHIVVAKECIQQKKNLLTASYVNDEIRHFKKEIEQNGLLFLYEMGLDPGIDHMSALTLLNEIHEKGGVITSFLSHCGGLVSPESDNNPWHYKVSWNPRNVVTAGKDGAHFKQQGEWKELTHAQIFEQLQVTDIQGAGEYAWYPNRDSLSYMPPYGLENIPTFIRTTLRHPSFIRGWKKIIALKLCEDAPAYELGNPSLQDAWQHHISQSNLQESLDTFRNESVEFEKQIQFLGLHDSQTRLGKNQFTPADLLQFAIENKLKLYTEDKDMILMQHEIKYEIKGKNFQRFSTLIVQGDNAIRTAMAKTVGLPLGIAAAFILNEKITCKGLQVPLLPEIYQVVLKELEAEGICFHDRTEEEIH